MIDFFSVLLGYALWRCCFVHFGRYCFRTYATCLRHFLEAAASTLEVSLFITYHLWIEVFDTHLVLLCFNHFNSWTSNLFSQAWWNHFEKFVGFHSFCSFYSYGTLVLRHNDSIENWIVWTCAVQPCTSFPIPWLFKPFRLFFPFNFPLLFVLDPTSCTDAWIIQQLFTQNNTIVHSDINGHSFDG
jgi:hypothetical protein